MARKPLTKAEIKSVREKVKILRDKGILHVKNLNDVTPTYKGRFESKYTEAIKKFKNVLAGKADVVPAKAVNEKGYRKIYTKTVVKDMKGRKSELLIVPHSLDETVSVRDGKVVLTHPQGIERIQLPIEYQNLEQYLKELERQKVKLEGAQRFAFRFHGGSSNTYRSFKDMIEELRNYKTLRGSFGSRSAGKEVFQNLELVRVYSTSEWRKQQQANIAKGRAMKKGRKKK